MQFLRPASAYLFVVLLLLPSTASSVLLTSYTAIPKQLISLVKLAEQERQLAATAGDGLVLRPFNDMLDGIRAAMRVSKEEFLLETASTSATEGTNAASSIKQRLTKEAGGGTALTQAEGVGSTPGTLKSAEGRVIQAPKIPVDDLHAKEESWGPFNLSIL